MGTKFGIETNQSKNGKVSWDVCKTLHFVRFFILLRTILCNLQCFWFIWEKDHFLWYYISRVFTNVQSGLSQCNIIHIQLRLLQLLNDSTHRSNGQNTIKQAFSMFYTLIKHGFWPIRVCAGSYLHYNIHLRMVSFNKG